MTNIISDSANLRQYRKIMLNRLWGNVVVLCYHRVKEFDLDPYSICITPDNFESHLGIIKTLGAFIRADLIGQYFRPELFSGLKFVITLDDGYSDNFETALPLLRKHDVPATFFVTANDDGVKPFWWDILQAVFLMTETLPQKFRIKVSDFVYDIDLKSDYLLKEETRITCKDWKLGSKTSPTLRHEWLKILAAKLKALNVRQNNELLISLMQATGTEHLIKSSETASTETLKTLAADERYEIGSHTFNHPCLSNLSVEEQSYEIVESKKELETRIQREVLSFAFPHGGPADYTKDSVLLAEEAGYRRAFTCRPIPLNWGLDSFQIPRVSIGNLDATTFRNYILKVLKNSA